jgi:AcrR family transcriptional regulator
LRRTALLVCRYARWHVVRACPGAPCRRYADRDALVSAVVAEGYRELAGYLSAAHPSPSTPEDLAAVGVAYVQFAFEHPALFRTMFSDPCDGDSSERVAATTAIAEYVGALVRRAFRGSDPDALSTAVWAVVHGLAFLHLDGKRPRSSPTGCVRPYLPWSPCHQRPDTTDYLVMSQRDSDRRFSGWPLAEC